MTDRSIDQAVAALCAEMGVVPDWVDAWGNTQAVSQADLLGVLSALTGRTLDTHRSVLEARADVGADRPPIEPVIVAWDGDCELPPLPFDVVEATVVLETGETVDLETVDGVVATTPRLPVGYHELMLNGGAASAHIFSAPTRAHPAPREALGIVAPVYSLRSSQSDLGIGTVAELTRLADLCDAAGIEVVGTLPMLASFPDHPSPYAPVSRRAWSELFVDFAQVPGWSQAPPDEREESLWVDYERTGSNIRNSLAQYAAHVSDSSRLRGLVEAFLERSPEMTRYAEFRALGETFGRNWRVWPESAAPDPERTRYHETVQWLMDMQLGGLSKRLRDRGQYLYVDLPIGCHPDGFDIWNNPGLFAKAGLGAPPDLLFVGGQDWGLPASIPSIARADGHLNFRKAIRHQFSVAGLLRIDHVMGIHRTWWVPHGVGANQGAYVMQPAEELFAIICLESARARAGVVGENLGTVPPEIGRGLAKHNLLGITVVQDTIKKPSPASLVAMSSHDTPAFAAWWKGLDIDDMLDLSVFDESRAATEREDRVQNIAVLEDFFGTSGPVATRDALITWITATDAAIALLNLDDLLMEERRQNVPGTDSERPNWRLRNPRTIDDLAADSAFLSNLRDLAERRAKSTANSRQPTADSPENEDRTTDNGKRS